jgi:hypothetical protein
MSRRSALNAAAAVLVLGAGLVLVISAISTSSARVTATTSSESFFAAGEVSLRQPDAAVEMLIDADGLYPGLDLTGCVDIEYTGSVPASLRVHGALRGGSGLDEHVDLSLRVSVLECAAAADEANETGATIFDARLVTLWERHPNYDTGAVMRATVRPGDRFSLHAVAALADDNRAQGLTTDFSITIEVRP